MLEQLKELLEMQRVLDENILREKGITEYPLDNMKIALFVELGELMNEFPTKFKHWKSSAVDNREKGLVEYVDCLHFALSLVNYAEYDINDYYKYDKPVYLPLWQILASAGNLEYAYDSLEWLFALGNYLGFTWEEIYNAYKKKNEVNYQRLRSGY